MIVPPGWLLVGAVRVVGGGGGQRRMGRPRISIYDVWQFMLLHCCCCYAGGSCRLVLMILSAVCLGFLGG